MIKFDDLSNPSSKYYFPFRTLVFIILGLAIYYQTFAYGFVFDDNMFIVNNPFIKNFNNVHYMWLNFPKTRLVVTYTFAFNYWINHLNPEGYHIFNFLIHLLTTGLVWLLTRTIFKVTGWHSNDHRLCEELAFVIALLFLVHPGQTQAVTYISQRFESMAALFYMGSIFCYLQGRIAAMRPQKILFFVMSACCALLGIFTKETAVTIPLMILAVEFILLNKYPINIKKSSPRQLYLFIGISGAIFFVLFIRIIQTNISHAFTIAEPSESHDGDIITAGSYFLTQGRVFLTFLRLLILPINQNLDYDYPLSSGLLNPPFTLVGLCLILLICILIIKLRKQWPLIAFGLAWILITFAINMAPRTNVIFEHKLYLISYGFFLATICMFANIIKDRKILFYLLIFMVAALALTSYKRNQIWKSDSTLWEDVVSKSPHKARPHGNRGYSFYKQGNYVQAIVDYDKAIELDPKYARAYSDRGFTYYKEGSFKHAMSDYDKAIELNPKYAEAYSNRGLLYDKEGGFIQALADYDKAIAINSNFTDAYSNRGVVYAKQDNITRAMQDFNKAIEIDPNSSEAYANRGLANYKQGNFDQAMSDYNKALEINPEFSEAVYSNRGIIYEKQSNLGQAIIDFNKAIEINPKFETAYANRGRIYWKEGNLDQAVSDYNKAIFLNIDYPSAYKNRAIVYYQLKQYDKAWQDVRKAEALGIAVDPAFISALKKAS